MDTIRDQPGEWWVTTARAKDDGARLAGPFPTLGAGITARRSMEADRGTWGTCGLWVLDAADPDCPAATTEGE